MTIVLNKHDINHFQPTIKRAKFNTSNKTNERQMKMNKYLITLAYDTADGYRQHHYLIVFAQDTQTALIISDHEFPRLLSGEIFQSVTLLDLSSVREVINPIYADFS